MSREELEARQNLPDFIRNFLDEKERGIRRAYIYDRLWELCYGALLARAEEDGMPLSDRLYRLGDRAAQSSGGPASPGERGEISPTMRSCPASGHSTFTSLLSQLEGQKNPLEAERIIDGERLKQIYHCQGNDPFSLDALLAFLSRAMIYSRWERHAGAL